MTSITAVEGSGDHKILVLHGWVMDAGVWLSTRALTDVSERTFAFVDFPGYGSNRGDVPLPDSIDGMADIARTAVRELGWTRYSVLGHSMGATTALRVASLAPDDVESVVAVSPVSPAGTPMDENVFRSFSDSWNDPAAAIRAMLSPKMDDADLRRLVARNRSSLDREVWDRYLTNWTTPSFAADLQSYGGPVTLAGGEDDPFVSKTYLDEIAAGLRDVTVRSIAGAGHYPMIEAPRTTADVIDRALASRVVRKNDQ